MPDLKKIYLQQLVGMRTLSPFEQLVGCYLSKKPIESGLIEQVLDRNLTLENQSPWYLVEKWRETLVLLLVLRERNMHQQQQQSILQQVRLLNSYPLWREFQLLSVYQALVEILLDRPLKDLTIVQLSSGACPLESGNHLAWGDIPHPIFHAELGTLWCLYAKLTGQLAFLKAAERLSDWQQNILDNDFVPFAGLYSQEGDAWEQSLLTNNYLLFESVSRSARRADLAFAAKAQYERLISIEIDDIIPIPCHVVVLEAWMLANSSPMDSVAYQLPISFKDVDLALAGSRTENTSAAATLYGGGTGMGSFHRNNVHVVSFGPQHFPLGDCRGFGIEGSSCLLKGYVKEIASESGSFKVAGIARMTARPKFMASSSGFRQGDPGGLWIDAKISFQNECMDIEAAFTSIYNQSTLAFVYFVKGQECLVNGRQIVKPRSFQHYQGEACPIQIQGKHDSILIEAGYSGGEMSVIPLGGGKNFWGADFLIAYICTLNKGLNSWKLS